MIESIPWFANPCNLFFSILLALHWGYSLAIHKEYTSKEFGVNEREALKKGILTLPACPLRDFLLLIVKFIEPPPAKFKIKTFQLKEPNQKVFMTHEIMGDPRTFIRVASLALLGKNSFDILHNLQNHLLIQDIQEKHIARFLAQFWQVDRSKGWRTHDRNALRQVLRSDPSLRESFKEIIEYPLSDKDRTALFARYDIPITNEQKNNIYEQTLVNRLLQENERSKDPGTIQDSELNNRLIGLQAKQKEDIMYAIGGDDEKKRQGNLLES